MARALAILWGLLIFCAVQICAQVKTYNYRTGEVRFTQGEQEITLKLQETSYYYVDTASHRIGISLRYSPEGRPGTTPTLYLHFWKDAGPLFISSLEVSGPRGNTYYDPAESKCTVQVSQMDVQGVEGSGKCEGSFEGGGPPIRAFSFSGRR